jgi:hypothetical protein
MADIKMAAGALHRAVHALATENGTIIERLSEAAAELVELTPDAFPEEMRDEYEQLFVDLSRRKGARGEPAPETPLEAMRHAIAHMDEVRAGELAERVLSLYVCTRIYLSRQKPDLPPTASRE